MLACLTRRAPAVLGKLDDFGDLMGVSRRTAWSDLEYLCSVNLLAKTLIPGLLTAGICLLEGLSVQVAITEVPQAATRAVVRSMAALFLVSAIVSVLTYF